MGKRPHGAGNIMAKPAPPQAGPSWDEVQDLFQRGDPAFVEQVRRVSDAERLGKFAAPWYKDRRPEARRLLLEYLKRPLNAYRHEALVKRLYKRAEEAGDDEVIAHFLLLFDRSVRRQARVGRRHQRKQVKSREAAKAQVTAWRRQGFEDVSFYNVGRKYHVYGWRTDTIFQLPDGNTMPRPPKNQQRKSQPLDESRREDLEQRCRLFSPHTRYYLRRRAWRYFRQLGKQSPERYVPAVSAALRLYENADVASGLALLDNWGLVHALFHDSPALHASANGWTLAAGHSLAELAPAPIYGELWKADPRALFNLLQEARCRPVRQWALFLLRRDHADWLAALALEELFGLLGNEDAEVAALAAELLRDRPELDSLPVERWLGLLETASPQALDVICELMAARLHPERLSWEQLIRLAGSRPLPVARMGFAWLRARPVEAGLTSEALLGLAEAEAEPLRPQLVRWAREILTASPDFRPEWVLEFLDSRHADVRAEGWRWLTEELRARDNIDVWKKLFESPYDDVRLLLVAELEDRVARGGEGLADFGALDAGLLRLLWATVLLNIHRGGRTKPLVVRQLLRRLERRPHEAPELLPLLAVSLRSVRGPEWRAGLAAVVQLVEHRPEMGPLVREPFPELELEGVGVGTT
jgi:hypothetical protein